MRAASLLALFAACCTVAGAAAGEAAQAAEVEAVRREVDALEERTRELIRVRDFDRATVLLRERGGRWQRSYGAKSWPMAQVALQLAETYLACGPACGKEADAAELYERSAAVLEEIHGKQSPEYAAALEKAADAFVQAGQHKRACRTTGGSCATSSRTSGRGTRPRGTCARSGAAACCGPRGTAVRPTS